MEWTDSREQLPPPCGVSEKHHRYLATIAGYEGLSVQEMFWWNGWNRTQGDNGETEVDNDYVIAWMPLPEPYRPKKR